jgi:hypothetical protein
MVDDLRLAGLPRRVQEAAATHAQEVFGFATTLSPWSLAEVVGFFPRWLVPVDVATAEVLSGDPFHGGMVFVEADPDPDEPVPAELVVHPELELVEYPVARRVAELQLRIGAWWGEVRPRVAPDKRAPWML